MELDWYAAFTGQCFQRAELAERGTAPGRSAFPCLALVLRHPEHGWVVLDTGYGPRYRQASARWPFSLYRWMVPVRSDPADALPAQLRARGIAAEGVRQVLLSHAHADHCGTLADFPKARLSCGQSAWVSVAGRKGFAALSRAHLPTLWPPDAVERLDFLENQRAVALPPPLSPFAEGRDVFGDGSVLAVPLPGHAPGQWGFTFRETGGRWVFYVADAAWSVRAVAELRPPHPLAAWLVGHDQEYLPTLRRLHALQKASPEVTLIPCHCAATVARLNAAGRLWRAYAPATH